jgi:hypothetical protein
LFKQYVIVLISNLFALFIIMLFNDKVSQPLFKSE